MKKIIFICFIFLVENNLIAGELINKKYENIFGTWSYYNEVSENNVNTATLKIENCKNNECYFSINGVSKSYYLYEYEGKIKITNTGAVLETIIANKTCYANVVIDNNKLLLKNLDKSCDIFIMNIEYERDKYNINNVYKTGYKCENLNFVVDLFVCTNKELAELDLKLNSVYIKALNKYKNNNELYNKLRKTQKDWINLKMETAIYFDLLKKLYDDRIKMLECCYNTDCSSLCGI